MNGYSDLAASIDDAARLAAAGAGLQLRRVSGVLELAVPGGPAVTAASELLVRPRQGALDPLWRATLAGRGTVIDATAGLGADAFHLAAKGASVTLCERSVVLVALLRCALERAASGALGPSALQAAARMRLIHGDALGHLSGTSSPAAGLVFLGSASAGTDDAALTADVVYLDPMFPYTNAKAAPPKGMAVLRQLFAGTEDEWPRAEELALLTAARQSAARRVVVKRARKAAPLGGQPPSGSFQGRTVRYDLYAPL